MKVQYISDDGRFFESEEACRRYEREQQFSFGVTFYCGDDSDSFHVNPLGFNLDNLREVVVEDYHNLNSILDAVVVKIDNEKAYDMLIKFCDEYNYESSGITGTGIYFYNPYEEEWLKYELVLKEIDKLREDMNELIFKVII